MPRTLYYAAFVLAMGCTNYGLLEKLENPGGATNSGSTSYRFYIFVTNTGTDGTMVGFTNGGCSGTGFIRADCACNDLAMANGLIRKPGGNYIAWLSGQTIDMSCRLQKLGGNSCPIPVSNYTWYNTNEELVATSYSDLFDGSLQAPVRYTETKGIGAADVWTGTDSNGYRAGAGAAASNCTDWNNNATASPQLGMPTANNGSWTQAGTAGSCGITKPIYCIGVP